MRKSLLFFLPLFLLSISCKESEKEITGPKKTITILKNRVGYVIGDVVNVRSKPTIKSKVVGTIKHTDWVTLTTRIESTDKQYKTWYKIIYNNNRTGYIYSKLVVVTDKKIADYPLYSKMTVNNHKIPKVIEQMLNLDSIQKICYEPNISDELFKGRMEIYLRKLVINPSLKKWLEWLKDGSLQSCYFQETYRDWITFDKIKYNKLEIKTNANTIEYTFIAQGHQKYSDNWSSFDLSFFNHHQITNYSFKKFSRKITGDSTDVKLDFLLKHSFKLKKINGSFFISGGDFSFISSKATISYRTNTE